MSPLSPVSPAFPSDGRHAMGTIRGEEATLIYHDDRYGGALFIDYHPREEVMCNRNIAAVIVNKPNKNFESESHEILLISAPDDSAPNASSQEYDLESIHATNLPQDFLDANSISPKWPYVAKNSDSNICVVISTCSGTGEAQRYFENVVRKAFASSGLQEQAHNVHVTDSDKSIATFARTVLLAKANDGVQQTILLLSGDGGIVDIVNVLLSSERSERYVKPSIGLIAMGTGNALANSTGLNGDATRGLRHFYRGQPHSLPTFTATFSPGSEFLIDEGRSTEPLQSFDSGNGIVYGAVVCSWGLHASLVAESDTTEYRRHGSTRFSMAAKELLAPSDGSPPHLYKGKITLFQKNTNGTESQHVLDRQDNMYILATLVSNLEEKLIISPDSKPLDGQLRLLHFGEMSAVDVMRIMGMAYQGGGHVEDEAVGYERIEGMRIDFDEKDGRWRRICVDGKIIRVGEGGWMEVRKNSGIDIVDIVVDLSP